MENGIGPRQSLMEILGMDQGWVGNECRPDRRIWHGYDTGNILQSPPRLLNRQAVWHRLMNSCQWFAGASSAGAPWGRTVPFRLRMICPCCWGAIPSAELGVAALAAH